MKIIRVTFLVGIALFMLVSCKSTNYLKYYRNMNEAQFYFYQKDYKTARQYYEQGFKKVKKYLDRDLLYYASCLWKTGGNTQQVIAILDTNCYFSGSRLSYFEGMSDSLKSVIISRNKSFVDNIVKQFYSAPVYLLLDSIWKAGYAPRKKYYEFTQLPYQDSTIENQIFREIDFVDSSNQIVLDSIFKHYGYPGATNWLLQQRIEIHQMMLHTHFKWLKENKKMLFNELKKGHILPIDYAMPFDRNYYGNENQYYYQYVPKWDEIVKQINAEEYFKHANSIGLSPYFYYEDRFFAIDKLPKTTPFYEHYKSHKSEFNCVK